MAEQTGGYDYDFVETPSDDLTCKICYYPSKEPHLSACCGHTFCKSCLEAAKRAKSVSSACPVCRSKPFATNINKQNDRKIKNLYVYCFNKKKGCEWQGEMNAITGHLNKEDGCQFEEVNCPNNCKVPCQRRDLTNHFKTDCPRRKVRCQYCHDTGEHQFITGQHKGECPKVPLPCPNNCEAGTILREDMEKHMSECHLEVIGCLNNCGAKIERRCLSVHVETDCPHRRVNCEYCHYTGEHQFIEGQHKEECPKLPQPCPYKCGVGSIPRDELTKHTDRCSLEDIQCKYHIVGCDAILARKDHGEHNKKMVEEHLSLFLSELTIAKTSVKNFREQILATIQHHAQEITHGLTEKVAIIENEVFTFKEFTNSQSEQNADMKTVSHEVAVIKEEMAEISGKLTNQIENSVMETKESFVQNRMCAKKDIIKHKEEMEKYHEKLEVVKQEVAVIKEETAEVSGKLTDQIKNSVMETKESFMQDLMCVKEDITKHKEEMEKYHEELKVVKQELQATKEQTAKNKSNNFIILLMPALILMFFYMHHAKLQSLESELKSELEIQYNIKKDQITENLMLQLQRLEEKCNFTKLQTKGTFKNSALVAKLQEDISSINKTALEGIIAVNKTALEGIIAVNKSALESISIVNKTTLESISTFNKSALESISDLKAQLPFLYCSFSYPSFYDELITKADKSQFNFPNAPVIVKISGISDALRPSCIFYREVDVANLYGDTIKLLLYKYNSTHMLIRLCNQESIHKYKVWFKLFTVRLMNQVTDSDHYKLNLLSKDFWLSDEMETTVHCSLNQFLSFGSIYKMTRTIQYIGCDSAFFLVDHPDFYKWF